MDYVIYSRSMTIRMDPREGQNPKLLAMGAAYLSDRAVFLLRVACRASVERVRSCRGERPVSAVESETGRRVFVDMACFPFLSGDW